MRAVVDTNVLLSSLLWRGPPHTFIQHARDGTLTLISSPGLLAELTGVLARPKFHVALAKSDIGPERMLADLRLILHIVDPPPLPQAVSRDPDDDAVLALAVAAMPDVIVTGDRDLLTLESYVGVPIVEPARAIALLHQRRTGSALWKRQGGCA